MLIDIRRVSKDGTCMLKGSSQPFPKHEPWFETLVKFRTHRATQGSPSMPSIATNIRNKAHEDICIRGGGGEAGTLKTECMMLSCPKCTRYKNVASCTLFSTRAMPIYCSECKISTMSSKWQCSHNLPWLQCPSHREEGFRCRSSRSARRTKTTLLWKELSYKAKLKRLTRLGHLGQHRANKDDVVNSIGAASMPKKKDNIKKDMSAKTTKSGGMQHYRPSISDLSQRPRYKKARITNHNLGEQHDVCNQVCNPGPGVKEPSASSARAPQCVSRARGGCPSNWTIQNYCEACHG